MLSAILTALVALQSEAGGSVISITEALKAPPKTARRGGDRLLFVYPLSLDSRPHLVCSASDPTSKPG